MSLWQRYDAMLFDIDGVIMGTTSLHAAAWARVFEEFLLTCSRDDGRSFEPFAPDADYVRYIGGRAPHDAVAAFLGSRGIDLPRGYPDDPPDARTRCGLANRKSAVFAATLADHGVEVFPDAVALLDVLAYAGKQLAVISASEGCEALLERADLLDRFSVRVTGADGARRDPAGEPAPDALLKAADLLGVYAVDAIVFDDSVAGVRAGRAGGFGLVIGVDRRDAAAELAGNGADLVVRDLREVITMEGPAPARRMPRVRRPWETKRLFEAILLVPPAEGFGDAVLGEEVAAVLGRLREHHVDVAVTEPGEDPAPRLGRMVGAAEQRGVGPGLVLVTGWLRTLVPPAGAERASVVSVLPDPPPGPFPPSMRWTGGGAPTCLALLRQQAERRDAGLVPGVDLDPAWTVTVHGDDPRHRRAHQSLLTIADTRFGTRGVREEEGLGSLPRVLAVGVFDDTTTPSTLLQGPTWTGLHLLEPLDISRDRRTLDLRGGVLARELAAEPVPLRTLRFASLARPGCFAMRAEGAVDWLHTGHSLIPPVTDGTFVRTQLGHLSRAQTETGAGGLIAATTVQRERNARGRRVVERLAFYAADPDGRPAMDTASAGLAEADRLGFEALLAEHRTAWARRWDDALVCIDGDPDAQLAVRFSLFQLMANVPTDGEAAVGARGVSGASYRGHVFWDADVFALPFFAATCPPAARAMLEYRLRRLGPAYRAAAERHLRGVRFPWESARTGVDVTPRVDRPPQGPPIPITTGEHEEHIVADVAWAAWQYAAWTGDEQFLHGAGRPLLLDTARYWASRVKMDGAGRGHIDDVIGPDEYHEHVDDDVFTNVLARWNLRRAAALAEEITRHDRAVPDDDVRPADMTGGGGQPLDDAPRGDGVAPGEVDEWRRVADALVDNYDPDTGRYEQFHGYATLEPLVIRDLATTAPVAADLLFGRERIARSQIIKQPDVLMLHHLVPEETAPGSLGPNLTFYEPRCAHASSLSPAIHAALFARDGRPDEALDLFRIACRLDLDNLTGTTAAGLHLATFGGVWQALAFGFLGVRPLARALLVDPRIPRTWQRVQMRLRFHGARLDIQASPDAFRITSNAPADVVLTRRGAPVRVVPGEVRRWRRVGEAGWELA